MGVKRPNIWVIEFSLLVDPRSITCKQSKSEAADMISWNAGIGFVKSTQTNNSSLKINLSVKVSQSITLQKVSIFQKTWFQNSVSCEAVVSTFLFFLLDLGPNTKMLCCLVQFSGFLLDLAFREFVVNICLYHFFTVPRAPTTTGINVGFRCHAHSISISRSLFFDIFYFSKFSR